jgi:hypothetical protein
VPGAESAKLSLLGLNDGNSAEVATLLASPAAAAVRKLDLSCNSIGPVGVEALFGAATAHPLVSARWASLRAVAGPFPARGDCLPTVARMRARATVAATSSLFWAASVAHPCTDCSR